MDFIQLKYFMAVVDENNLTRAAEQLLHISQPALSKAISRLEDEVGSKLFHRVGRQLALNENGKVFYEWAKKTLADYESLKNSIRQSNIDDNSSITIAICGRNFSAPIIRNFHQAYPHVKIKETTFTKHDLPGLLYQQHVDFILSFKKYTGKHIQHHLISRTPLHLIVPSDHPLALRKSIYLRETENEAFVIPSSKNEFYDIMMNCFQLAEIHPHISAELEGPHVANLVSEGIGMTICSEAALPFFNEHQKCRVIALEDSFCFLEIYLLWHEQNRYSSAQKHFIDFMAQS